MIRIPTFFCPKPWENMSGDETSRFCTYCQKHVHNLEALSVSERWALLSSPAASICSRYRIAIRRPARGKEESYLRHLLKYGAGVAVTGSVLLVLWEMPGQTDKSDQRRHYRAGAPVAGANCEMPDYLYEEHTSVTLGMIALPPQPPVEIETETAEIRPVQQIDIKLDPVEIDKLLNQIKPPVPDQIPLKR